MDTSGLTAPLGGDGVREDDDCVHCCLVLTVVVGGVVSMGDGVSDDHPVVLVPIVLGLPG